MNVQPVKSSQIEGIGYDECARRMRVCFRNGTLQDFLHVPKDIFTAFVNARSKNRFYKRHIQDCFPG